MTKEQHLKTFIKFIEEGEYRPRHWFDVTLFNDFKRYMKLDFDRFLEQEELTNLKNDAWEAKDTLDRW